MRTAIYIIVFIIVTIGIAFTIRFTKIESLIGGKGEKSAKTEKKEKKKDKDEGDIAADSDIRILHKYDLPAVLKEISAMVYLDKDRFACVQDEQGKIFIYNITTNKVEKEVPFAGSGDYEGLAIAGKDAFVLRADGTIFEVKSYASSAPKTIEHKTHLTVEQDTEGLCYDSKNKRLLVTVKGTDLQSEDFKGIYGLNLADYKMDKDPVYRIDLNDAALADYKGKKQGSQLQPSAIAIHPINGDLYITEGTKPKLLIMDNKNNIKSVRPLSSKDFNQPEGISFSPEGDLYISNEGNKAPGNILQVDISVP